MSFEFPIDPPPQPPMPPQPSAPPHPHEGHSPAPKPSDQPQQIRPDRFTVRPPVRVAMQEPTPAEQPSEPVTPEEPPRRIEVPPSLVEVPETAAAIPEAARAPQPLYHPEQKLAPAYANTPVERLVECSIQPVDMPREPVFTTRLLNGVASRLEVPEDPQAPLKMRFVEARQSTHEEMRADLGLPDQFATLRDPDLVDGIYAAGLTIASGKPYTMLSLSFGSSYSPEAAKALATAVSSRIAPRLFAALPPDKPASRLRLTINGANVPHGTVGYLVPRDQIAHFNAQHDTHREF